MSGYPAKPNHEIHCTFSNEIPSRIVTRVAMKLRICLIPFASWALAQTTPVRTVVSDCPRVSGQPLPVMRGGYCIRLDTGLVYGPTGQFAFAALPQLPGASTVYVHDVAVDPDGGFVVAAGNRSVDGLALFDQYGSQKTFIPLKGFYPSKVTISEDHSIWVLVETQLRPEEAGDYMTVLKYSSSGQLIGSFLPLSSFPAGNVVVGIGSIPAILSGGGVVAVIVGSSTTSNTNWHRELIRMDYSGKVLSRNSLDDVHEQAFAMTADGNLYRGDNLRSLPVYLFNASAQSWQEVVKPTGTTALVGADGANLIFHVFDGSDKMRLSWYAQPGAEQRASRN